MASTFVDGLRAALNTPLSLEHTPADADATATPGALGRALLGCSLLILSADLWCLGTHVLPGASKLS